MRRHDALTTALIIGLMASGSGCSREQFRQRADDDVQGTITQKNIFPDWKVENWHVYPDPRARFADPSSPDYPPYPPDDYAAYILSPNPQKPGRGGAGREDGCQYLDILAAWDASNRADDAARLAEEKKAQQAGRAAPENPSKLDPDKPGGYDPNDPAAPERGEEFAAVAGGAAAYLRTFDTQATHFKLRINQTVELALFNSREFQDRREDLYLAALPVTLERFNFTAQAFATERIIREATGSLTPEGPGDRFRFNSEAGLTRTFSTGAQLLLRLANQVTVELANGRPDVAVSNLSLTLVQPLLRGGGFAVTLEPLTQSERTLLYAIRSFARFRSIFYYAIAGGGGYTNNPYGLQGLSANLGRGIGANLTANPVGFLPAILQAAILENQRKNVATLEQFLRLFQNLKEGGGVPELQVVRVEQTLIRSRTTVLNATRQFLDTVDNFKLQLGVPATLPLELDDAPLRPIRQQLNRFEQVYDQLRELEREGGRFNPNEPAEALRRRWEELLTNSSLVRGTPFAEQYRKSAGELRGLPDDELARRQADAAETRRTLLDARAERELAGKADTAEQLLAIDAVEGAADRLRFERLLRRYESQPWRNMAGERRAAEIAIAFRAVFEAGMLVAVQPRNDRLTAIREGWPAPPAVAVRGCDLLKLPLDDAYALIGQEALVNRLDLMNARAQVVDAWRQITVQANRLQGVLNVGYNLDAASPPTGTNGWALSGSRTRHQLVIDIEPPLVRREERNTYRAALIAYQRQRRTLMAFEDNILTDSRTDLRQLRQLAESYRLQQRAVELAYAQVDNARGTFVAPPDPGSARGAAGEAAALTQQLLEAQNSLLQAQNDLYTTWTNYATARMELFLDLELLPLDEQGLWNDAPPDAPAAPAEPPAVAPPERLPEPRREVGAGAPGERPA